jgi:hypothetical protein
MYCRRRLGRESTDCGTLPCANSKWPLKNATTAPQPFVADSAESTVHGCRLLCSNPRQQYLAIQCEEGVRVGQGWSLFPAPVVRR